MPSAADVDGLIQQARKELQQGEHALALATYERAVKEYPTHIGAHEGLATAAFIVRDYERAVSCFKRVSQLDPRRAQPLVNLGAVYNRMKDYQQAAKILRQALSKDRRCAEAYYNLGIAQRGLKQLPMAVSAYREAIRLDAEMAEAYQNLANVYTEMGNTQQAILNYRRALELRPDFERAKRGLEQAQNAASEAKRLASPFGRLVNMDEAGGDLNDGQARALSPQERFEDRTAIHKHAKEMERAAALVLNQVREQLESSLLQLTHSFSQSDNRYNFKEEFRTFQRARGAFEQVVSALREHGDELREHEQAIRE